MIYSVKEYGGAADGKTLCTEAVQKAVDICHAQGGGIVRFEGGRYALSTVFLKSNVTIQMEEGVEILGAERYLDYAQQEKLEYPLYQDASHSYFHPSLFVGIDCENIKIIGAGKIDMRSVWDVENVRDMVNRGAKCIALKGCKNVEISGLEICNVTDLAVYFAGCENVDVHGLKMRVYIDGISPDNSKNVRIHDCDIVTGDDGIVFKSSYTLNRLDICKDIHVWDCKIKSRCNAIKFGTETNGGFEDILIENISIVDTRICGIAIESVDGAVIDEVTLRNISMKNVNAPIFVHLGKRMRGPEGRKIGAIKNVVLENITAEGPYEPYETVAWNYESFLKNDVYQEPWKPGRIAYYLYDDADSGKDSDWQMTSNICGLKDKPLENITLKNVTLRLEGVTGAVSEEVPEDCLPYPEVNCYGKFLPAKGIFFRHIKGLRMENVTVETNRQDTRQDFVYDRVSLKQ